MCWQRWQRRRQNRCTAKSVDQILADEQVQPDGTSDILWPLTDHLGTVRDLAVHNPQTNLTTIANHLVYDAYGRLTSQSDPRVTTLFGFTARPFDSATGLQNNLNRWYDAKVGRWLSEDPIGFAAADANLYRYVGNDPTGFVDPTGEVWWNPFTWFDWGIDWSDSVDEELSLVQQLNHTFGTSHTRLDAFTTQERARIEAALGQKVGWEDGPIKASQGALKTRQHVLVASEVALWTAGAADAAAGGLVGLELAGVTSAGSTPLFGTGAAGSAGTTALSSGAKDALLRFGSRPEAMAYLAQLRAIRDALPRGGDAYIVLTQRLQMLEAFIDEAFPL